MSNFEAPILELNLGDSDELVEEVCTSTEYSCTGFKEVDILPDHDVPLQEAQKLKSRSIISLIGLKRSFQYDLRWNLGKPLRPMPSTLASDLEPQEQTYLRFSSPAKEGWRVFENLTGPKFSLSQPNLSLVCVDIRNFFFLDSSNSKFPSSRPLSFQQYVLTNDDKTIKLAHPLFDRWISPPEEEEVTADAKQPQRCQVDDVVYMSVEEAVFD